MSQKKFSDKVKKSYEFKGDSILVGLGMLDGEPVEGTHIRAPLKMFNRHGLIAGATGTGKTRTLQHLAGELSKAGVPSLVMDMKGDLSGLAVEGVASDGVLKRAKLLGEEFKPEGLPVEFLTLSKEPGARLRATVSEFGPVLMSRILDLNDNQAGLLGTIFKFADDRGLLLLDLKDLKKILQFVTDEGKEDYQKEYGNISSSSAGTILRKVVALEGQGADKFFGEKSFDVEDLTRTGKDGRGIVNILRVRDIQTTPALFSTFMLQLLAEIYEKFPEEGDLDKPKLVLFIDEAHLIFSQASNALLEQIEMIMKLIRSKSVGVFYCTQVPSDVPDAVLSQLGFKFQHALRAFTAKDRKAVKKAAENFPLSDFYETDRLLGELGTGEALVTVLNEKGKPTELVHSLMAPPVSRMDVLKPAELKELIAKSTLTEKYNEKIDRKSAYEILDEKLQDIQEQQETEEKETKTKSSSRKRKTTDKEDPSFIEKVANSKVTRDIGRTVAREVTRGILGVFGISTTKRRRKRKSSWF